MAAISSKSWGLVNKSKLPKVCFLWIEGDGKTKDQWHLPVYEGAGGINPKTGMYRKRGPLNRNAVKAAWAAIHGARTGKSMRVPSAVRTKLEALRKRCGFED